MAGVTVLISKNKNTGRPNNYRPVTCLPTIYITIASINDINLMQIEHIWCCRGSK
jgi:hypothetical protein